MQSKNLLYEIVKNLEVKDISKLCLVSPKLNNICGDNNFWRLKFRADGNVLVVNTKPDNYSFLAWFKFLKRNNLFNLKMNQLLMRGVELNVLNLVKYAVQRGANVPAYSFEALSGAMMHGRYDIVVYLIEHGANINVDYGYPLRTAATLGYYDIVVYLVEHGADIHVLGDVSLKLAAVNGHNNVVRYLIEHGANVMDAIEYATDRRKYDVADYLKQFLRH